MPLFTEVRGRPFTTAGYRNLRSFVNRQRSSDLIAVRQPLPIQATTKTSNLGRYAPIGMCVTDITHSCESHRCSSVSLTYRIRMSTVDQCTTVEDLTALSFNSGLDRVLYIMRKLLTQCRITLVRPFVRIPTLNSSS